MKSNFPKRHPEPLAYDKSTARDKITTNIDKKNFNSGSYKYLRGFFLKTAK